MENKLYYLDDKERFNAYQLIINGCGHFWSKNQPQYDKIDAALTNFALLAEKDPLFLAHLTSWATTKSDSKDLQVLSVFANFLSDADGTRFMQTSTICKPNWRIISQAALNQMHPRLVLRVLQLARRKAKFGSRAESQHYPHIMKTAAKKYLRYREQNPKALEGIKANAMVTTFWHLYRLARLAPSSEACRILGFKEKPGYPGHGVQVEKTIFEGLDQLSDLELAQKIQTEKIPATTALLMAGNRMSPVLAAAILEQSTGNQAIILTETFEEQGLLKNPEVQKVYVEKIKTAKTAIDRVERIKTKLDADTEEILKQVKSEVRKKSVNLNKVFMHIDISGSMQSALEVASDKGAIIAEFVKDPKNNFRWGCFNDCARVLPLPAEFTKVGFKAALYGLKSGGGTNCLALYPEARAQGCDLDVYVTDGQHTYGQIVHFIQQFRNRGISDPRQVIIVKVGQYGNTLARGLEDAGIPVVEIDAQQLSESALVSQIIQSAAKGTAAIIDEIMSCKLLSLPKWWSAVDVN